MTTAGGNMFVRSYHNFMTASGKKTMISPEEMFSNFTLSPEEIDVFLSKGTDDLKKTEKTKEEIEKDKDVIIESGLEATDPRNLLR